MSDMIRREDAMNAIQQFCRGCDRLSCGACSFDDVMFAVDSVSAVDAVKVVRCAECIYAYEQSEHADSAVRLLNVSPRCPMYDHYNHLVVASGYCCKGVRKENCNK